MSIQWGSTAKRVSKERDYEIFDFTSRGEEERRSWKGRKWRTKKLEEREGFKLLEMIV